mmetsp:Transcript_1858/g.1567  ORF Transcript_1858/g.1567 Transcript_1858/m.1567 type:complete len:343 (-) Transcript_1858:46-1074(-)
MGNEINTDTNCNNQNNQISPEVYFNTYIPSSGIKANSNGKCKDEINSDKIEQIAAKINSKSNNYIHNFANKWLHKVDLRPVVVTNKLYGMNNKQVECQNLIETTNNTIIHHSGIEVILLNDDNVKESYLIFPNYPTIIADLLIRGDINWRSRSHVDIKQSITSHFYQSLLDSNQSIYGLEYMPLYGYDFGYIREGDINPISKSIQIKLECKGMYQRLLFENEQFKSKSALPMDILHIICDEYLKDMAHNDVGCYEITAVTANIHKQLYKPGKLYGNYDWICHKLNDDNSEENIIFNTAINVLGKYFTLETIVNVSCYHTNSTEYKIHYNDTGAQDHIIGKIY